MKIKIIPDDIEHEELLEFKSLAHQGIASLPLLWKSVLIMKYLENETVPEICSKLHLSLANYWKIGSRAKHCMRNYVELEKRFQRYSR